MADEFLSQEEIDALLGGGESTKEEEKKDEIAPFDFSQVEHLKKGGVPGLELLFERWVKVYREEIRRLVPQVGMITKESVYITRFNNFMIKIPMPASYSIVSMKPFKDNFLFILDSRLVFVVISVMFGGPAQPFKIEGREFTKLETRIIDDLVRVTLTTFEKVWQDVYPVQLELRSIELNPALARIVSGNEKVIVVESTMDIDGYEAPFFFCFPQGMFMPIKELIFSESLFAEKDPVWENHLRKKLLKTEVRLSLEVARKQFTLREILEWKLGDSFVLDVSKGDLLKLYVEESPKFYAKLGKVRDKYAAKVVDFINGEGDGRGGKAAESGGEEPRGTGKGVGGSS
ncbi:flagellar motor switch protein FliM [Phorcysia thermohydrogeniphila]|uniref:Flagellar motor switch protein FliM n=1 Tax=Phorcysia thermohydrogeniphila TaxID=936138 RepID=A0A4R1GDW8_9BACT|nr:flagellar motor switch protein FliM [Phorcysia thermohydrogeniphila]TCK03899.1 flagellar motor switch protein FliM [Phorcysia thermohydrogeniphila]